MMMGVVDRPRHLLDIFGGPVVGQRSLVTINVCASGFSEVYGGSGSYTYDLLPCGT